MDPQVVSEALDRDLQRPARLLHRVEGVVDQVEEDLLQLGERGANRGQIGLEDGAHLHVGVLRPLGRDRDGLLHERTGIHLLRSLVGLAGEAEQLVGDLLAAVSLGLDLLESAPELLEVLRGPPIVVLQDVPDPARLLHHDRDGVVDLVGDPRGQLAHRRQLARFDHLLADHLCAVFGLGDGRDRLAAEKEGHADDDEPAEDHGQQADVACAEELRESLAGLLLVDQVPAPLLERRGQVDVLAARLVPPLRHADPALVTGIGSQQLVEEFAIRHEIGGRFDLELPGAVQDERGSRLAVAEVLDEIVERDEVDRGPEDPGFPVPGAAHRDDEVRKAAQAGEDVADEVLALHRVLEPARVGVVGMAEQEGARVGHLGARLVDHAQIDEDRLVDPPQIEHALLQEILLAQLLEAEAAGQHPDVAQPGVEESVDVLLVLLDELFQVGRGPLLMRRAELVEDDDADDEQRRHSRADDQRDPVARLRALGGVGHLSALRVRAPH